MKYTYLILSILFLQGISVAAYAQTSEEFMTEITWKTISFCNDELSFSSPFELTQSSVEIPPDMVDQLKSITKYSNVDNGAFLLTVQCVQYHAGFKANIKKLRSTTEAELAKLGVNDISMYKSEAVKLKDIPGLQQEGSFVKDGLTMDYVNLFYYHDSRLWQIMFAHEQHDLFGYAAQDNVTRSIAINLQSHK